jgi:ABC-type uncharacterized transport system permease subunit
MRRDLSWKELCEKSWGKELHAPEYVYEFTNRKFYNGEPDLSGITLDSGSLYADNYADDYA